jgi:hypothetical protein
LPSRLKKLAARRIVGLTGGKAEAAADIHRAK